MGTDPKPVQGMRMLWHYTVMERLHRILQDGEIRPSTAGIPKKEKPAVWFSSNAAWEPSANRLWQDVDGRVARLSKDQTFVLGGGLARIGVAPDVAPHDWKAYKRISGMATARAKTVYDEAIRAGARPGEWFASFDAVGRAKWLTVEAWDGERWMPHAG